MKLSLPKLIFNNSFTLFSRTPHTTCCYIPRLPPKKALGGKEIKFIAERRFYLERFLRKCAKFEFIVNSEEFLLFSRPIGDVEKLIAKMGKI
jgi:hypothetical protein